MGIKSPGGFPLEINTASYQELLRIPGIGPISSKRIIQYRQKTPFVTYPHFKA